MKKLFLFLALGFVLVAISQSDAPTFQDTRLVNMHTNEMLPSQTLQFRIGHRFGALNGGFYELWGLDQANMRLGFEYGLHKKAMLGWGRTSSTKTWDLFAKVSILEQGESIPVSLLYLGTANINGNKELFSAAELEFVHRLSFTNHLILTSKLNERISLMLQPSYLHQNLVSDSTDKNDMLFIGVGAKYSVSRVVSLTSEYIYRFPVSGSETFDNHHDSFSLGVAFDTKGHYFSLHLTNSASLYEQGYLAENFDSWKDGGIRLGFNIIRNFDFK